MKIHTSMMFPFRKIRKEAFRIVRGFKLTSNQHCMLKSFVTMVHKVWKPFHLRNVDLVRLQPIINRLKEEIPMFKVYKRYGNYGDILEGSLFWSVPFVELLGLRRCETKARLSSQHHPFPHYTGYQFYKRVKTVQWCADRWLPRLGSVD